MNAMYDITQFIVVVLVPNETESALVDHFMHHVLLKFSIYHLVLLDDDRRLKGVFSEVYKELYINFDILAKINHKGLLVE